MKEFESNHLLNQYESRLKGFENATRAAEGIVRFIADELKLDYLLISSRVKSFESFFEKIDRKGYQDPFAETTDFCGIRIVLFYQADIQPLLDRLGREFAVRENRPDTSESVPDRFGYRSHHLTVAFPKDWLRVPHFRDIGDLTVEIQVRTILMHAWAEIEHQLGYKSNSAVPSPFRRKLAMISAKLEEADQQFADITRELSDYRTKLISESAESEVFPSDEVNQDTIAALLLRHFPDRPDHRGMNADLFQDAQYYNHSVKDIELLIQKIKPYAPLLDDLVMGKNRGMISRQNLLAYANDIFNPLSSERRNLSNSRQKIVERVRTHFA